MEPIVSLIQARMSSSRLPGKVLMPLGDGVVLDQVIRRANLFSSQVIVCTSVDPSDDAIVEHCESVGTLSVRGPLDDVFMRFRQALKDPRTVASDWFCRITADCPLVSVDLAQYVLEQRDEKLDYLCLPGGSLPLGLAVEVVNRKTFEALDPGELDEPAREHVTLHLYETGRFAFLRPDPPASYRHPELRLTLDYQEDYELFQELFERIDDVDSAKAVRYLLDHPELAARNRDCQQKPARPEAP